MDTRPIGVMDSGVGGLTVLKEIQKELPQESIIYIGDSKNAPYGKRTAENIQELSSKLIEFLLNKDVKLIVIACNTITVNGIDVLRSKFPSIPIVGTVPVVKGAVAVSKKKKIGLLVTGATAKSTYNQKLIDEFAKGCEVVTVGTNKLVPLIETHQHNLLPSVVKEELMPFKKAGVDVVILGSTHFPILREYIQKEMGENVLVLDSGGAIARQVKRILSANNELNSSTSSEKIFTTGEVEPFAAIAKHVLGENIPEVRKLVLE